MYAKGKRPPNIVQSAVQRVCQACCVLILIAATVSGAAFFFSSSTTAPALEFNATNNSEAFVPPAPPATGEPPPIANASAAPSLAPSNTTSQSNGGMHTEGSVDEAANAPETVDALLDAARLERLARQQQTQSDREWRDAFDEPSHGLANPSPGPSPLPQAQEHAARKEWGAAQWSLQPKS